MSNSVICNVCKESKSIREFYKNSKNKSGFDYRCKNCRKIQASEWNKNNKQKRRTIVKKSKDKYRNRENAKARLRYWGDLDKYRAINRECNKRYYLKHKDKEKLRRRQYYKDNLDKVRDQKSRWHRNKMKEDVSYILSVRLRSRLNKAVRYGYKSGSAVRDLGCSIEEFKNYLELLFKRGMSWENYGEWHMDHIIPLASFDLSNKEQLKQACHYTNLQPLWAYENLKKNKF